MYACAFVCFSTKAVHFELAGDLSANSYTAALERFTTWRGRLVEIFSDYGTNYIRAKIYLKASATEVVDSFLTDESVKWTINVSFAPHFGVLWEAAVKSMKFRMRRTKGSQILSQ